jgi:type I restriction enzyme S subunit
MELKRGYKQTELGVIPEDWDIKLLDEISKITRLAGYEYSTMWEESLFGEIIALRGFNIGKNRIIDKDFVRISNDLSWKLKRSRLFKGDVIYPCVGSIGNAVVIEENDKYHIQQNIAKITPNNSFVLSLFLSHYLMSFYGLNEINKFNGSSSQPNILVGSLRKYSIILPPKSEQTAIAQALSDADAYITSLEKLIEKKKAVKQGAMQELLKPKDGWHWVKLGDIGKTFGGLSGKSKDDFKDGEYPYIPFMNIMTNPIIDTEFFDFVNLGIGESQNRAQKGDLFFNGSSETPEEVGMCSILLDEIPNLYLNSFCFGFRLKKELNINGLYLTYFFRSKEGRDLFSAYAQGATRYNLSKSNFNKIEVPIPEPNEQNFIAHTLRNIDSEIELLKEKLKKANYIKQGMMQNLLTGKIRLI